MWQGCTVCSLFPSFLFFFLTLFNKVEHNAASRSSPHHGCGTAHQHAACPGLPTQLYSRHEVRIDTRRETEKHAEGEMQRRRERRPRFHTFIQREKSFVLIRCSPSLPPLPLLPHLSSPSSLPPSLPSSPPLLSPSKNNLNHPAQKCKVT